MNFFKPKLKLVKGTRFTSLLFITVSLLIAAGILFAANVYFDIDTGRLIVEEVTRILQRLEIHAPPGTTALEISQGNIVFSTPGTITQTGTGQVIFTGNVDALGGLDVTGAPLTAAAGFRVLGGATEIEGASVLIRPTGAVNITAGAASVWQVAGALTVQFDHAGGFILQSNIPGDTFLVIEPTGRLTILSQEDLVLDAGSGAVRIAEGDILYVDGIALGGEGRLIGIVPIFGFDFPAQTATTSYIRISRTLENYPFPPSATGTTRVHRLVVRYTDNLPTTLATDWRVTNGVTHFHFTLPGSNNPGLDAGQAIITPPVGIPAPPWRLEVKNPAVGNKIRVFQIFLLGFDVMI